MVEDTWKSLTLVDSNGMINLKKKLQALKIIIKQWTKNAKKISYKAKISIKSKLSDIDKILDQGDDLERIVSNEEIKSAVWDCGTNKSSGPDGFTFELFRIYWKLLEHDIVTAVKEFFTSGVEGWGLTVKRIGTNGESILGLMVKIFSLLVNLDGFDKMVEDTWKSLTLVDSNGMINLKKKLQALKIIIKQWTKNAKKISYKAKISIQSKLSDIDKILDQGGGENKMFFHGILNSKHSQLAIRGTLVDGEWIVDPLAVKSVFLKYFSTQFSSPVPPHICFTDQFINRLSLEQQDDLERILIDNSILPKELVATRWVKVMPIKINVFAWRVCLDKLPTRLNLSLKGLFSSIPIDSSLTLSHLFFADDAIFVEEVDAVATTLGCSIFTTLFVHLGGKVGGAMSRIKSWDDVVAKVSSRLSKWKLKTLLIDDLTLNHKFPRLYALNNYKQITIVDKINHASMVDSFRRPPRGGAEEEKFDFLLSRMDGLILTNIPDRWVWSLEATAAKRDLERCLLCEVAVNLALQESVAYESA
nr:RNA-directed DNA polymerase, eukaryota, reverse transcriptase zinc-binding domain protein [Tanacetum cinerariifolium]